MAAGTSLSYLTRDILLAVTGNELGLKEPQVSNDETLNLPEDLPAQTVETELELKTETDVINPLVSSHRFSENSTHQLLDRARRESTSAHGAIFKNSSLVNFPILPSCMKVVAVNNLYQRREGIVINILRKLVA